MFEIIRTPEEIAEKYEQIKAKVKAAEIEVAANSKSKRYQELARLDLRKWRQVQKAFEWFFTEGAK